MPKPVDSLLLEFLQPTPDSRILLLEGGDGWLAAQAARFVPDGEVLSLSRDVQQVWATQAIIANIPNAHTTFDVFPTTVGWDFALLSIPKERRYARTLLVSAWGALKPGGRLLLAGPGKSGAKAVITDAERLFGNGITLSYRHHQRLARSIRGKSFPNPLPSEFQQPGIAPSTQHFVEVQRSEGNLKLETHPGIFSWDALDEGTALLLQHLSVQPGKSVWDVGCGYGVIGLSAALAGAGEVAMSDVNLLAVKFAQRNSETNGLAERVHIFPADGLNQFPQNEKKRGFDLIVSNPAFHQGRKVDKSMADSLITRAANFLNADGRLLLVANRFLNYDKFMQGYFRQVTRLAETNKFHVIEARK